MHALGSTMPNLNTQIIASVPFVLPPHHLDDHRLTTLKSLFKNQEKNHSESQTLAALRDTLLPQLLSGELRVAEAEKQLEEVG